MSDSGISSKDQQAILDNLRRYASCLDRADGAGVAGVFTRDGEIDTARGHFKGPAELADFVAQAASQPGFAGRQHQVQPRLIEKTEDGYLVTSYWMVITWHAGAPPFYVAYGYYRDTCVLEDGEWRFREKIISRWDAASAPLAK